MCYGCPGLDFRRPREGGGFFVCPNYLPLQYSYGWLVGHRGYHPYIDKPYI